jgi:hypothetical protein
LQFKADHAILTLSARNTPTAREALVPAFNPNRKEVSPMEIIIGTALATGYLIALLAAVNAAKK